MSKPMIFWDPQGFEVDSLGNNKFLDASDGDTPHVSVSIRMLSIDTPEVHYPGNTRPSRQDEPLAQLAEWIQQGHAPLDADLATFMHPKLATGEAGTLQATQGKEAKQVFQTLVEEKLTRPTGSKRQMFLHSADQPFDRYGRLLAYVAPSYTRAERAKLSPRERATFNLLMVESGWAASFPIYPSLPKYRDLSLLHEVSKEALLQKRGAWADPLSMTGYEFRMCVKLHKITARLRAGEKLSSAQRNGWISRYCVDMTTREIAYPQHYCKIAPYNRIFIWPRDVTDAVGKMNLLPLDD